MEEKYRGAMTWGVDQRMWWFTRKTKLCHCNRKKENHNSMSMYEWEWVAFVACGQFLQSFVVMITWDWVAHSPTGVALESAPSQYLGLAGRVVCSGTVLAQPFKWIRMSAVSALEINWTHHHLDLTPSNTLTMTPDYIWESTMWFQNT